ncbi:hypothetical protein [Mycobacterium ulcerans]|uniref:hypothetical protein n=1 Tax=Mycobacterium ulcerans TaxID=1809 RepID=UPI001FFD24A7|nr:hypothetical protein [Mycobacterium ulcerans]
MSARARLALYATGMAALFGAAFLVGGAVIAHPISTSWARSGHAGHQAGTQPVRGVSLSAGDLMLDDVAAPPAVGVQGTLSFRVQSLGGVPVTRYAIENAKKLHLIVVRSDGTSFRHVHPTMSAPRAAGQSHGHGTPPVPIGCSPTSSRKAATPRS